MKTFIVLCISGGLMLSAFWFFTHSPFATQPSVINTHSEPFPSQTSIDVGTTSSAFGTNTAPVPTVHPHNLHDSATLEKILAAVKAHGWGKIESGEGIYVKDSLYWHLEFQPEFGQFMLTVHDGYPALEIQHEAEATLLDTLGMSKEEVCALGVSVYWKNFETEDKMMEKSLTFCGQ